VLLVASTLGSPYIVGDHVTDNFAPVFSVKQILSEPGRDDLRHMLVLGNGQDLVLIQSTKSDALLQGDHDTSSAAQWTLRSVNLVLVDFRNDADQVAAFERAIHKRWICRIVGSRLAGSRRKHHVKSGHM
jgi:hypothetical protein